MQDGRVQYAGSGKRLSSTMALLSAIQTIIVVVSSSLRGFSVRLCFLLATLAALALTFASSASAGSLPRSVVIIESANPGLPFDAAMASAMRSTLGAPPGG